MAEYHIRWDPTTKKWEVSQDGGAFADLVENPLHEHATFNGISSPGGVASKGRVYYDSAGNRLKVSENNGAFSNLCREDGYPAPGLDINGLTEDTSPNALLDFLITHDNSAGDRKKVKPARFPAFAVRAEHSANVTVNTGSVVLIPFDSEQYDTHGFHDISTNNSRLTVPSGAAGYYRVTGHARWASGTAGTLRQLFLEVDAGGTDSAGARFAFLSLHTGMAAIMDVTISADIYLSDSHYVEMFASSGENTTINRVSSCYYASPALTMHRIGA